MIISPSTGISHPGSPASLLTRYGMYFLACLLVLAVLGLGGCASPSRIVGADPAFDRTGRFAVTVEYVSGKQEAVQGGFAWHDTGDVLLLNLANPLGSTLAQLQVRPGQAVLTRTDGSREMAPSAEALVERLLGGPLPVADLREWLRGRVSSQFVSGLTRTPENQIEAFEQDGWKVQLSRYDDLGPRRLQLRHEDHERTIRVRLTVDGQ